ncbi:hypothetical protein [Salinibacter sp.]|uniref:hypothetical protein n=1 Tax=Salinibacter sp. TaxID=2065818 RepID=UPI0021E91134|nr:hypothetical protein [Salinibacter sp.]
MSESPPSPERIVAALRTAIGAGREQEPRPTPSRRTTQNDGGPSGLGDDEKPGPLQKGDAEATKAWVEETVDAFRAAGGEIPPGAADDQAQGLDAADPVPEEGPVGPTGPSPASAESERETAGKSVSGGAVGEETRQSDEGADAPDDLALAFRRAFYARRVRRRRPSQTGSSEESPRSVAAPARPASSFLWITGRSEGRTAAIGIHGLSGPRARRAGAFLLRGRGKTPYHHLRRIRHHPDPRIFLKPVFWRADAGWDSPVADHVDGTWTPEANKGTLRALRERAVTINRRIRDALEEGEARAGTNAERRLLFFVATRTEAFSRRRVGGSVVYPRLTPLLGSTGREKSGRDP